MHSIICVMLLHVYEKIITYTPYLIHSLSNQIKVVLPVHHMNHHVIVYLWVIMCPISTREPYCLSRSLHHHTRRCLPYSFISLLSAMCPISIWMTHTLIVNRSKALENGRVVSLLQGAIFISTISQLMWVVFFEQNHCKKVFSSGTGTYFNRIHTFRSIFGKGHWKRRPLHLLVSGKWEDYCIHCT